MKGVRNVTIAEKKKEELQKRRDWIVEMFKRKAERLREIEGWTTERTGTDS